MRVFGCDAPQGRLARHVRLQRPLLCGIGQLPGSCDGRLLLRRLHCGCSGGLLLATRAVCLQARNFPIGLGALLRTRGQCLLGGDARECGVGGSAFGDRALQFGGGERVVCVDATCGFCACGSGPLPAQLASLMRILHRHECGLFNRAGGDGCVACMFLGLRTFHPCMRRFPLGFSSLLCARSQRFLGGNARECGVGSGAFCDRAFHCGSGERFVGVNAARSFLACGSCPLAARFARLAGFLHRSECGLLSHACCAGRLACVFLGMRALQAGIRCIALGFSALLRARSQCFLGGDTRECSVGGSAFSDCALHFGSGERRLGVNAACGFRLSGLCPLPTQFADLARVLYRLQHGFFRRAGRDRCPARMFLGGGAFCNLAHVQGFSQATLARLSFQR